MNLGPAAAARARRVPRRRGRLQPRPRHAVQGVRAGRGDHGAGGVVRPKKKNPTGRGVLLKEQPFTFRQRKDGSVAIFWKRTPRHRAHREAGGELPRRLVRLQRPGAAAADGEGDRQLQAREREADQAVSDGNGLVQLTKKDFTSDQEVRWCPGCGDYAILAAVQSFMPELGLKRENIVFVSGIGCAARFPYYMETYGMHSIHGRAPAIATGLSRVPPGPVRLGRDRRRRLDVDRRQPPDPRAAPEREPEDPDVQQPDLRADEGPVLADERAGEGDEVDADGLARPPVQPAVAGDRRRGDVRRARDRHRQEGADRGAPRRRRSTRGAPSSRSTRTATSTTTTRSTSSASRRRTGCTCGTASRSCGATRACGCCRTGRRRSSRRRSRGCSCTTRTRTSRRTRSRCSRMTQQAIGATPMGVFRVGRAPGLRRADGRADRGREGEGRRRARGAAR